ncbi:MAG: M28 family metallopeptidase [Flavobacteriaceae bacterium]|jgi:Zn-dependent M28 family amino/carboxypeptidase|nr:M28 family metallopeptidase [Flavobacteriaceae bacterium]
MKNLSYICLLLLVFSCGIEAQKSVVDYAESITETELKTHLYTYASDEFMGREAGTEGETLAINFLKDYYESTGVSGGSTNGSYFQEMTVTDRSGNSIDSYNVLGYIEGSDKANEVLVITSHLDHIGVEADGQINNGADDDGSGTVAMMEIAEAFIEAKEDGNGPRRSVLFLHVSAEEKGLLGSKYYTDNPIYPLVNTVANLNIDMIGRVDSLHIEQPDYIYLIGSDILSDDLHDVSEKANQDYVGLTIDYRYNDPTTLVYEFGRWRENRYYYRSDHYHFIKNNIPAVFYFNGTHKDYHAPTDTVEKINYALLEKRTRLIFHTAWEIVNREERLTLKEDSEIPSDD